LGFVDPRLLAHTCTVPVDSPPRTVKVALCEELAVVVSSTVV
jgi:hypothetical protein